jgi:hypothetical protein
MNERTELRAIVVVLVRRNADLESRSQPTINGAAKIPSRADLLAGFDERVSDRVHLDRVRNAATEQTNRG